MSTMLKSLTPFKGVNLSSAIRNCRLWCSKHRWQSHDWCRYSKSSTTMGFCCIIYWFVQTV